MTEQGAPNLRRFRRRTLRVRVEYQLDGALRSEWATTLGAGGMFVETAAPPPVGTRFAVRFRLPSGGVDHALEARVAWIMGESAGAGNPAPSPGMGVAFVDGAATAALAHELDREPGPA
jgi:uncharacterized protein (TIGR02266 family)